MNGKPTPRGYVSLAELSVYAGVSLPTIRGWLADPVCPLRHYQPEKKILVKLDEFDEWIARFANRDAKAEVKQAVAAALKKVG